MSPVRVLVVDDERELVAALVERLEIRGFDAHGAHDAPSALDWLSRVETDVAVVDVMMPEIGGIQLCREIRREHPDTAVVLLTGCGPGREDARAHAAGARSCLTKPADIEDLARAIRAAARREP